jgi:hypothetical protein
MLPDKVDAMARGHDSRLDAPAASGVPVKQGVEEPDVPEFWLLERDLHEQAERIDRLAADWNS